MAAHIKCRSNCSDVEKRDMTNVMPMCKMGCDDLFEKGYVSVSDNRIKRNSEKLTTSPVAAYIRALVGLQCKYWNKGNAQYFAWRQAQPER